MAPPISPEPRRLIGRGPGPPAPAAPSSAAGPARGRPGRGALAAKEGCRRRGSSEPPSVRRLRTPPERGTGPRGSARRGDRGSGAAARGGAASAERARAGGETLCLLRELGGGATGTATRAGREGGSATGKDGRGAAAAQEPAGQPDTRAAVASCARTRCCRYFLLIFCPIKLSLSQPARFSPPHPRFSRLSRRGGTEAARKRLRGAELCGRLKLSSRRGSRCPGVAARPHRPPLPRQPKLLCVM